MALAARPVTLPSAPAWRVRATPAAFGGPVRGPLAVAAGTKTQSIVVKRNPPKADLEAQGVFGWPTWGCGVSKFPWSYGENETCYVLEGRVVVTPDGGAPVEIQAGDMATFPAGMSCTWDVKAAIRKHYNIH